MIAYSLDVLLKQKQIAPRGSLFFPLRVSSFSKFFMSFRSSEDIFNCFRRDTEGCNSVAMVLAQFYMEWLLRDCPLNKTIISYDILHGVSSCSLQLGYNLYNGLQMSSDFTSVLCAAGELHQLCLTSETIPQMALLYMEQNADMLTVFQQNQCSGTLEDSFLLNFEGR